MVWQDWPGAWPGVDASSGWVLRGIGSPVMIASDLACSATRTDDKSVKLENELCDYFGVPLRTVEYDVSRSTEIGDTF
jgi:hypothetical protein